MEILISKISANHDDARHYDGVMAYGKAVDDKTYVLKAQQHSWFVIYRAEQLEIKEIFNYDDEIGDNLIFTGYDEAIQGFQEFLERICLIYFLSNLS